MNNTGLRKWEVPAHKGKAPQRIYALKIGGSTYERWRGRFRELSHDAQQSGDWREYYDRQQELVTRYGKAAYGYNLPPGAELPPGFCFGTHGCLDHLPVEADRPLGTCWDDAA